MLYTESSIIYFMNIGERITKARDAAKMSKADLARKTGITKQGIGKIENGETKSPTPENLLKIATAINITMEELITGNKRYTVNEHPKEYLTTSATTNISEGPSSKGLVPLISWVQAGNFCEAVDLFEVGTAENWYPCPVNHSKETYILRVQGTSMEPEYRDGDLIFVDPHVQPNHNSDIVLRLVDSNTATFKRLQIVGNEHYVSPINKEWPESVIRITELAQICGVVIFSGRLR